MGLIYFLGYLFLEIVFSYEFMKVFTPFGFFLEIIISAVAGIYIIKNLDFSLRDNLIKLMHRELTEEEFISVGLFKLIGAFLLIVPGFFSDVVGILFLFEPFARFIAKKLFPNTYVYTTHNNFNDEDIIDVEIIEEKKKIN